MRVLVAGTRKPGSPGLLLSLGEPIHHQRVGWIATTSGKTWGKKLHELKRGVACGAVVEPEAAGCPITGTLNKGIWRGQRDCCSSRSGQPPFPLAPLNSCGSNQNMTVRIHQRLHLRSPAIHVASFFTGAHDSFVRNVGCYNACRAESAATSSPPPGIEAAGPLAAPTCSRRRGWCPGGLPSWRTEPRSPPAVVLGKSTSGFTVYGGVLLVVVGILVLPDMLRYA